MLDKTELEKKLFASIDDQQETLEGLLQDQDNTVAVWAAIQLVKKNTAVKTSVLSKIIQLSKLSSYLRILVAPRLLTYGLYQKYFEIIDYEASNTNPESCNSALLEAHYNADYTNESHLLLKVFLRDGQTDHIDKAFKVILNSTDLEKKEESFLRLVLTRTQPLESAALIWLSALAREKEKSTFKRYVGVFEIFFPRTSMLIAYGSAQVCSWEQGANAALSIVEETGLQVLAYENRQGHVLHFIAQLYEKVDAYHEAAHTFTLQNKILQEINAFDKKSLINFSRNLSQLPITEPVPEAESYVILTGFPRTGTTMLDNALSGHPAIAMCEETSSMIAAITACYSLRREGELTPAEANRRALFLDEIYKMGLNRYTGKEKDYGVIIDKTPIQSAYGSMIRRVWPNKKVIFTIRHPYDVVLSNWKQNYKQNSAMAGFNDLQTACEVYGYTMGEWFSTYSLHEQVVHYVYYDVMVTDFKKTLSDVLAFLKLEWDSRVLNFSATAKGRATKTPSYEKVRQGLSLGVQSSYQNYLFLFDDYCRSKLDPWVEFFGYTVEEPKK